MTIFEKMQKKFGDSCKWLECDDMCHANSCMLSRFKTNYVFDKFRDMNLKHPEVSYLLFPDVCKVSEDCYSKKYEHDHMDGVDEDGLEVTVFEREAKKIVEDEFSKLSEDKIKELYKHGIQLMIEDENKKIKALQNKVEELKNCESNII